MMRTPKWVLKLLSKYPGERALGPYRFIPVYFILGAALEFSMIKWNAGGVNFYKVYKRKQAEKALAAEGLS